MIIRKADIHDIPQLSALFDDYRIFYKYESDLATAKKFLSDRITNRESVIFVAENRDQKLAGFVHLYPIFSSTRLKRLWLLNDLFVDPHYRGQHVSVKLIDFAKQLALDTQSAGLVLETAKSNTIGNNLYPRTGFILDTDHNYYYWQV